MKRIVLLAALALALPGAVFASSTIDYSNSGGTLAASTGGISSIGLTTLTLSGSALSEIRDFPGSWVAGDLGSVTFTTGALLTGSMGTGGTFAAGGSILITASNGAVLFKGTFSGPTQWVELSSGSGVNTTTSYALYGSVAGWTGAGSWTTGNTFDMTLNVGKGQFDGAALITSGDTPLLVPEPGSLGLLGTGLIGVAGVVRRKLKA
jgi:hypothetical protein